MFKRLKKAVKAFFSRKGQTATLTPEKKKLEIVQMADINATIAVYEVKPGPYMDDVQLYTKMCMEHDPGPPYEPLFDEDINRLYGQKDEEDNDDQEGQNSS